MVPTREWVEHALCTKRMWPDAWFPDSAQDAIAKRAKAICRACPVQQECVEAGKSERHGIWGGQVRSENKMKADTEDRRERVSPVGPQRRLQALAALGWSGRDVSADIRRYTGILLSPRRLDQVRSGDEVDIPEDVAELIHRSYRRLGQSLANGPSATTTMNFARSKGWVTPREWRGYDIDDPDVWPDDYMC